MRFPRRTCSIVGPCGQLGTALLSGASVHPRVAQQLLRHASSKTKTELHSHVTAAQERQAAEVLRAALVG
jgi:hypothetical protein